MTYSHIKVESDGPLASLTFNRPQVLNAFNNETMDECRAALQSFADDDAIRAVLVRGEGRAFSAGFVPLFSRRLASGGHQDAQQFSNEILSVFMPTLLVVTVVFIWLSCLSLSLAGDTARAGGASSVLMWRILGPAWPAQ